MKLFSIKKVRIIKDSFRPIFINKLLIKKDALSEGQNKSNKKNKKNKYQKYTKGAATIYRGYRFLKYYYLYYFYFFL